MAVEEKSFMESFVEDAMKQKIRQDNALKIYEEIDVNLREAIIDREDLIRKIRNQSLNSSIDISLFEDRQSEDQKSRKEVQEIISKKKEQRNELVKTINAHLSELVELEISKSGFFAHIMMPNRFVEIKEKTALMKKGGRIEAPIQTYMKSWQDASQLRIIPKNI